MALSFKKEIEFLTKSNTTLLDTITEKAKELPKDMEHGVMEDLYTDLAVRLRRVNAAIQETNEEK
jgi:hypothetical protein